MSYTTGRYSVVRNAFTYDVIDQQRGNARIVTARSRDAAHRYADRLNLEWYRERDARTDALVSRSDATALDALTRALDS